MPPTAAEASLIQHELKMTHHQRFLAVMAYEPVDRVPNWELGVWPQTVQRWQAEGLDARDFHWAWFPGEAALGMDPKEFIPFDRSMMPPFEAGVVHEDHRTQVLQHADGRLTRRLKEGLVGGGSMSMDTYLRFPVETMDDWQALKRRYVADLPQRYGPNGFEPQPERWRQREHPLIFAPNCSLCGWYWMAREWMGTENLSYAWYDQPAVMDDMMAFWGDFLIEAVRPVLAVTDLDYVNLNEDLAMKTGPLLSPATYRRFILPHLKRFVAFCKAGGVRYISLDTDGNPEPLIPMFLEAGVDVLWPLERAADQDPVRLRREFGRELRLWGGVDKRELARGPAAIDAHLRALAPLVEQGGYVPTVDHTVPPDVSWANFEHYWQRKTELLAGRW